MQLTEKLHAVKIPFTIPVSPEIRIERSVYAFLYFGREITLIDSGVKGAHKTIFDYLQQHGREPEEIQTLILSHSHPDHIGSARTIQTLTGCTIMAHPLEKNWIENTDRQKTERPVPGFDMLVEGPVTVDEILKENQSLLLEEDSGCRIVHTPGHSSGSISLFFAGEKALFTGDALPLPGDLPIYDDIATSLKSITKLKELAGKGNTILSSWEDPIMGHERITSRIEAGVAYLERIHRAVIHAHREYGEEGLALCRRVVAELGLSPFAANPLVARSFMSSLPVAGREDLFNR